MMTHADAEYRDARARCPKCHTGEYAACSWVGLFAGEKCPACGEVLVEIEGESLVKVTKAKGRRGERFEAWLHRTL